MSAPLIVSFVMRAAFTFVDTAYAATIGDAAVAAIGLTVPFEFLMIALWVGLSTGLTAALSRTMSSGEYEKVEQYLHSSWVMVLTVSPLFLGLGAVIWFLAPQGGLTDEVYLSFRIYAGVLIAGSALTAFWSVIPDSIVKAHQDTRSTMWAGIWSNVINLSLNTLFLFVFHWGIFGIALSTVLGRIGGLVYALGRARAHEAERKADTTEQLVPGLDPHPYRTQLSLAVPAGLTFTLSSVEMAIINTLLATVSSPTAAIAAYSIYHRVALFAMNPIIATSVAMLPFAGRLVGHRDWDGVRKGTRQAVGAAVAYSFVIVGPILWLAGPWLAGALSESPLTGQYTTFALYLVPFACALTTPFFLARPVFEAMGRGKPGLIMAAARTLVTVPFAWGGMWLAARMGYAEMYGLMIALILVGALSGGAFVAWLRAALPHGSEPPPAADAIADAAVESSEAAGEAASSEAID
jgi:Na+-driven multidrug efflux pump